MKHALISVWDKTGLDVFVKFLVGHGYSIISTGGTADALAKMGVEVTTVESITGQPSLMGGRLKTLDPHVFGPILFDRNKPEHVEDLEQYGNLAIDLVVVNLYPFEMKVSEDRSRDEIIEFIDIGGPSLLRAAAKNHKHVSVLCDANQYEGYMAQVEKYGDAIPAGERSRLAAEVFKRTQQYDAAIANYLSDGEADASIELKGDLVQTLRYGENPHQKAAFYRPASQRELWKQLHGKALSFNNYADIETAYEITQEFDDCAVAIIKHANPCGFGIAATPHKAFKAALSTDPVSAFGGIVAFNREVDQSAGDALAKMFLECIIAPSFSSGAYAVLSRKKNLRLLQYDSSTVKPNGKDIRAIAGGYLVQEQDSCLPEDSWTVATNRQPTKDEMRAMRLGWKLVRFVKSNAIVFASSDRLLGVGAGQMSRVDSVVLAGLKAENAGLDLNSGVMASDAFFPFADGLEVAIEKGITAVIQPGGSVRDEEVIEAANKHNIAMVLTGTRHFRH